MSKFHVVYIKYFICLRYTLAMSPSSTKATPNSCNGDDGLYIAIGFLSGLTLSFIFHSVLVVCRKRRVACYKRRHRAAGIYTEIAASRTNNDYILNVDDGTYSVATDSYPAQSVGDGYGDGGGSRSDEDTDTGSTNVCHAGQPGAVPEGGYSKATSCSSEKDGECRCRHSDGDSVSHVDQRSVMSQPVPGQVDAAPLELPESLYASVHKGPKREERSSSWKQKGKYGRRNLRSPPGSVEELYAQVSCPMCETQQVKKFKKSRNRSSSTGKLRYLRDGRGGGAKKAAGDTVPLRPLVNPQPAKECLYSQPVKYSKASREGEKKEKKAGGLAPSSSTPSVALYATVDKKGRGRPKMWTDVTPPATGTGAFEETTFICSSHVRRSASMRCPGDPSQLEPGVRRWEYRRGSSFRSDAPLPPTPDDLNELESLYAKPRKPKPVKRRKGAGRRTSESSTATTRPSSSDDETSRDELVPSTGPPRMRKRQKEGKTKTNAGRKARYEKAAGTGKGRKGQGYSKAKKSEDGERTNDEDQERSTPMTGQGTDGGMLDSSHGNWHRSSQTRSDPGDYRINP